MPLNYEQKLRQVPGVASVAGANWFGGDLHHGEQLLPAVRDPRRGVPRHVPRVPDLGGGAQGVPASTGRARSPGASSPTSTAGRSATRFRSAARSFRERGRSRCARSTTAPTPRRTRRSSSSTGTFLNETVKARFPRRGDQVGWYVGRDPRPDAGRRDLAAHRRDVQELARRDAHRDREGVPARIRRDDRGDPRRDPGRVVRHRRHHHGGDGEHDGDDGARALRASTRR